MSSNQVAPAPGQPGQAGAPVVAQQPGMGYHGGKGIIGTPTQFINYGARVPMAQPPPQVWMPKPASFQGCPPGLEYLTQIDQILIKQQIDLLEVFTPYEVENKYKLLNTVGQQIYFAKENSEICERQWCLNNRSFMMHISDNLGAEVLTVERKFRCWANSNWCACCDCCAHKVKVQAAGKTVGYVIQRPSFCAPCYTITDDDEKPLLYIEGPCHMGWVRCPCDVTFKIISKKDGSEVGSIQKQWANLLQEMFTSADNFGVKFPMDLDVKVKATIIGATFLIDFMYFENTGNNQHHHYY